MIYQYLSIELIICITGLVLLAMDAVGVRKQGAMVGVSVLGLVLAGLMGVVNFKTLPPTGLFNGSYVVDHLSIYLKELMLLITLMSVLISTEYVSQKMEHNAGEFYALVVFVLLGMIFMASAGDLVTIFIALETTSMPLYVLAAAGKYDQRSAEAGMKFFLLGALASAFYLFGAAMLFGSLGTMYLAQFPIAMQSVTSNQPAVILGMLCVITGFSFKVAAAPFHMWAPDTYQGAPTAVTAFLSTGPKVAGVAVLLRLLMGGFFVMRQDMSLRLDWVLVISALSLLSMTVGNLVAMHQGNIKRMMAFSGIAHMGYIFVGLSAASAKGVTAVIFYQFLYTIANLGAWGVIMLFTLRTGSDEISSFAGMSRRAPGLSMLLMLAFISLAGLPPLGGFVGKFYLFAAAWESGLPWLVVAGVVNSVASLYYYLGVLRVVYFQPAEDEEPVLMSLPFKFAYAIALFAIVVLGLFPPMNEWAFNVATTFASR
ncbi:MAG: NADH-quinone oxidoreductase subunit N [Armatimonadetes bacterium]|nr:NADH-quinone oxidoreductase subunit N [Armatimonadota bacterium]